MKRFLMASLGVGLIAPVIAFSAGTTLPQTVDEDLSFSGEVMMNNVTLPDDPEALSGTSSAKLEGVGSVTVESRGGGGFPRMIIFGGTTVTSSRTWNESEKPTWWNGKLVVPNIGIIPDATKVNFEKLGSHPNSQIRLLTPYAFGLPNETFSFSPSAQVILPVDEADFTKIWIGYSQGNGKWIIGESDFCVATNGLCFFEVSKVGSLVLAKEMFSQCPQSSVLNGKITNAPTCALICDKGYMPDETITSCVEIPEGGDDAGMDLSNMVPTSKDAAKVRPGYFRYTDSRTQLTALDSGASGGQDTSINLNGQRYSAAEESLTQKSRRTNANAVYRTQDAQIGPQKQVAESEDSTSGFLDYLFSIRNKFGEGSSANVFKSGEKAVAVENSAGQQDAMPTAEGEMAPVQVSSESNMASSAPSLPKTGPGLFLGLALSGFGIMAFGVRRQK